jgi:dihydroorotate dehydrogenase (NAD+) catalytic subunit
MTGKIDLSVQIAPGLKLKNPVMTASGTFGWGDDLDGFLDVNKLGAVICKGTTLKPRSGNPQPRIIEVTGGMLNSIGLENIGVDAVIKDKAPVWAKWKVPVIVNIDGDSIDEYRILADKLDGVPGISGIEVNISCPNVKQGGIQFGTDAKTAAAVTRAVKKATTKPVIVKLSPNVTDITQIARAVEDSEADAISLINTLIGMAIDVKTCRPKLGNVVGGLSGPAIKPIALNLVYKVAGAVKVPVIGIGGIMNTEDALEFILAGATAVQVGTATLIDPNTAIDIIAGIKKYLAGRGEKSVVAIRGRGRV